MKKPTILILCLLWLFWSIPDLFAQREQLDVEVSGEIPQEKIKLFLSDHLDLAPAEWMNLEYQDFDEWNSSIKPNQFYYGKIDFQLSSKDLEAEDLVVYFPMHLTSLDAVLVFNGKIIDTEKAGFFTPLSDRTYKPGIRGNFLKFNVPVNQPCTLYFKGHCVRKKMIPNLDITYASAINYTNELGQKKQNGALFIGFVLMMLIYNLFLFFYLSKDIAYVYFSTYLFGIIAYSAYNTGGMADIFTPLLFPNNPQLIYFGKLCVYIIIISYTFFLQKFLQLKDRLPLWNKIFRYLAIAIVPLYFLDGALMIFSNFNPNISDIVTLSTSGIYLLLLVFFGFALNRSKIENGYFIVRGMTAMAIGSFITIFLRIGSLEYTTFYFRVGIVIEVIIFSLGLAERRKKIEESKQAAYIDLVKSQLLQEKEHIEAQSLKELAEQRKKLYTNITHEFRTPLTAILGMNENIENNEVEKEIISRNSNKLLRLINQLMDLSKIESGKMSMSWKQVEAISFLKYLCQAFHSLAELKQINLTFYSEVNSVWMDIDTNKMEQLLNNLIANAIKFTPEKGQVVVHVKVSSISHQDYLHIQISDTGRGIPETELPFIFDRFYHSADSKDIGSGIGLALVKEIVGLVNGTISVQSKIGEGSKFLTSIPITRNAKREELNDQNVMLQIEETPIHTMAEQESVHPDKPHIVVIEDNEDIAHYIKTVLKDDYNLYMAIDGVEGVDKVMEIIPDIVLSDVLMPRMNGYEVCRIIKSDERSSHIPVVLLTAMSTQKDKNDGLAAGANAFLVKPFNKEELLIRLDQIHQQRKALVEKYKGSLAVVKSAGENQSTNLENNFLQKLKTYILENLENSELNTKALGLAGDLSEIQVYRKIKALTGESPTHFIRGIRLEKALVLLKKREHNISEIAYKVGFKDPNYFSRVFHKRYGKSPREIIKG